MSESKAVFELMQIIRIFHSCGTLVQLLNMCASSHNIQHGLRFCKTETPWCESKS